ncbi:hypothetical protein [Nocardia sp. NPDC058633]
MTEAFVYEATHIPRGRGKQSDAPHGVKPLDPVVAPIEEPGICSVRPGLR